MTDDTPNPTHELSTSGVGPWQGDWPDDPRYDPALLETGDTRNVIDRYRYWTMEAIIADLDERRHPFHVAIENWQHDMNIGSIVRSANAFAADTVHIIGRRRWNKRGAMVTDRYQHVLHHATVDDFTAWAHDQRVADHRDRQRARQCRHRVVRVSGTLRAAVRPGGPRPQPRSDTGSGCHCRDHAVRFDPQYQRFSCGGNCDACVGAAARVLTVRALEDTVCPPEWALLQGEKFSLASSRARPWGRAIPEGISVKSTVSVSRRFRTPAALLALAIAFTGLTVLTPSTPAAADGPGEPFSCAVPSFFAQANPPSDATYTQLFTGQYLADGSSDWTTLGSQQAGAANNYNALAFNPLDGFLYGVLANGVIVRIDSVGAKTDLTATTPALGSAPATLWDTGEFGPDGVYYVANAYNGGTGGTIVLHRIDVATGLTDDPVTLTGASGVSFADLAYKDGYLWGHSYNSGTTFYRINPASGHVDAFSSSVIPAGAYGAAFTMNNNNLAFIGGSTSDDVLATMYQVAISDPTGANPVFSLVNEVSAPANARSDASNCSTAPDASLSLVKAGPATVVAGEQIVWTLTVTNDGPGTSSGFVLKDALPAGISNVVVTSNSVDVGEACEVVSSDITCNGGRLLLNETAEIVVTATAPAQVGALVNTARVIGNEDPNPDGPVAANTEVTYATLAGAPIELTITGVVTGLTQPTNGVVTSADNGNLVYTPAVGFSGVDSFTYMLDGSQVTVHITVSPTAGDDAASTGINEPVTIPAATLLVNDVGTNLTISAVGSPINGTVALVGGDPVFTPTADFVGTASFEYTITGDGGSADATVTVTVNAAPIAPDAVDDAATTVAGSPVTIGLTHLLSNDTGTSIGVTGFTQPTTGAVTENADDDLVYTPTANFSGTDTFTYTITGPGGTDAATVTITVTPVAVDDSAQTSAGTAVSVDVLGNDSGTGLTLTDVTQGTSGTVAIVDGEAVYTPGSGYSGPDSFTYELTDGATRTATATVTVMVTPLAPDDAANTVTDQSVLIDVLANDTGTSLAITANTNGSNGTVAPEAGELRYTPTAGFSGTDTFEYTTEDASGNEITATVTVYVHPVAVDDSVTTPACTAITFSPTANDDGSDLEVTTISTPAHGSVVINSDGTVTYTPEDGFSGIETLTYSVADGDALTGAATITIAVTPTAADDERITLSGNSVIIHFLDNDEGTNLTVTILDQPHNGTLAMHNDGTGTYTPDADFLGLDTLSYSATDDEGQLVTANVTIHVLAAALASTGPSSLPQLALSGMLLLFGAVAAFFLSSRVRRRAALR